MSDQEESGEVVNYNEFHWERPKNLAYAHEYAVTFLTRSSVFSSLEDPVQLWEMQRSALESAQGHGVHSY